VSALAPGGVIGILGGGQLGRMLALAAARLGLQTHIYSDAADAPAFQVTPRKSIARYDDEAALARFADDCDVLTYEFENIPAETVEFLAARKPVAPGAHALRIAQDRLEEKNFVTALGLKTAPFHAVSSAADAKAAFAALGGEGILKTRRFGYDGKGQAHVTSAEEAMRAFEKFNAVPCILEGLVDFAFEASVIAARGADGGFAAFDVPQNTHENHILRRSRVPSPLSAAGEEEAKTLARRLGGALDYVGVFAVELFVGHDGALLVNEIAPRVHNSGHWTIEACSCSQFEQHIRAVAGWPLGDTARHGDAVMENIIGAEADAWESLSRSGALHLYGKHAARMGRKMGHVTRVTPRSRP
jgi:5-(carboxyamino)imidazole ribonucleotide synthase